MAARRLLLSLGVAIAGTGAVVAHAGGPAPCASSASLRLVDSSPVTLAGSHFCAGERLRVRASAGGERRSHRVRAGARGRFRTSFPGLPYDPCTTDLRGSATGPDGVRASLKRPQRQCPVPLDPGQEPSGSERAAEPGPGDPCRGIDPEGGKLGPKPQCNVP